jgi:hypothetical protein
MRVVAFVTDSAAIGRILDHLGLVNPEAEKPPPPLREMLRVAEHGERALRRLGSTFGDGSVEKAPRRMSGPCPA